MTPGTGHTSTSVGRKYGQRHAARSACGGGGVAPALRRGGQTRPVLAVNRSYQARIGTDEPYVGLEVIGKLAEALEVEPAELLKVRSKRRRS